MAENELEVILHKMRLSGYKLVSHADIGDDEIIWKFRMADGTTINGIGQTDLEGLQNVYDKALRLDQIEKRFPYITRPKTMLVSPYRYPGAKGRHMDAICGLADFIDFKKSTYVEPFAGGGSSLFYLLDRYGLPEKIIMNDLDESVAAFWQCLENESMKNELVDLIVKADVTVEERNRQRALMESDDVVTAAFAGLFISRTSFSGLLRANVGPIGGREQKSKYPVDCRYNDKMLVKRVEEIYTALKGKVFGKSLDFEKLIGQYDKADVLFYLDPPYYVKGNQLYRAEMSHDDHVRLRDCIVGIKNAQFVMSYDDCDAIRNLYDGFKIQTLDAFYSVSIEKESRKVGKEVVITR